MRAHPIQTPEDETAALLALLRASCDEIFAIGFDIVRLGEEISGEAVGDPSADRVRHYQSFDLIAQRALAQARLLQGLEPLLAGRPAQPAEQARALIEAVPFHAERRRLLAALATKGPAEDAGVDHAIEGLELF